MDMKIPEFGSLQMTRTNPSHAGTAPLTNLTGDNSVNASSKNVVSGAKNSFEGYLLDAVGQMNQQQIDVSNVQQQLITDPDSVDIHDVTTAMAKAQMSLSLAQTVTDRLITGWNEITSVR